MWQIPRMTREGSYAFLTSFLLILLSGYIILKRWSKRAWYFLINLSFWTLLLVFLKFPGYFYFSFCVISYNFWNHIYFNHNKNNDYICIYNQDGVFSWGAEVLKITYVHILFLLVYTVSNTKLFVKNKCHIVVTWIMYNILLEKLYFLNK